MTLSAGVPSAKVTKGEYRGTVITVRDGVKKKCAYYYNNTNHRLSIQEVLLLQQEDGGIIHKKNLEVKV